MYTFVEMLDKKIKAAQTMGRIYVNPMDLNDKIKYWYVVIILKARWVNKE